MIDSLMPKCSVVNIFGHPKLLPPVLDWCYKQWWEKPGSTNLELNNILSSHVNGRGVFTTFVGLIDGKPVGSVHFIDKDFDTGDVSPCLAGLYVLPDYRGQGLATMLVNSVVVYATSEGFSDVYLSTETTESWYEKQGWLTIKILDASTNYVLMKKSCRQAE